MGELDDIFSSLSQGPTASKHSKRKRPETEGGVSKKKSDAATSSAVSTDASATHTMSSSKKAKSRTSNEGTSSSTSKKKDVPVVVHDTSKASSMPKQAPRPRDGDDAAFADTRGTDRKRTEEGFRIFTEEELKLNQGGGTPLCPFDCDCCY